VKTGEARIAIDALGWFLLCCGAVWLAVLWGVPDAAGAGDGEVSYLAGVWQRSLVSVFQGALMAAVFAVPFHALWTWGIRKNAADSYDRFGGWAQTLFTSLGFMGTIIGVSLAVAGLEDAMQAGNPSGLIAGLSAAFDTTFLGLTGAVSLMLSRKLARLWTQKQ
jgi:hypothetical protein